MAKPFMKLHVEAPSAKWTRVPEGHEGIVFGGLGEDAPMVLREGTVGGEQHQ